MKAKFFSVGLLVVLFTMASTAAFANDQIASTATNLPGPQAVIVNNGVAQGTIQLWYTYTGPSFPCGQFAQFNLALSDGASSHGTAPTYPVTLNLAQSGNGTPVQFSPAPQPATFSVTGPGWSSNSVVTVSVDCTKLPLGAPYDGQVIDGNLNEGTNPAGSHLDTISTIQAKITLVIPKSACLSVYSFETDQDGNPLASVGITANKSGSVKSTNPGEVSVDGMVNNNCAGPLSFDLAVGLDTRWQLNPGNNAGNATFTYNTTGEIDPTTFSLTAFGTGTPQGEKVCLSNVTLAGDDTFLVTEHSQIDSGLFVSGLPANFGFSTTLYPAGSACTGTALGANIVGNSNPATSTLTYTVH